MQIVCHSPQIAAPRGISVAIMHACWQDPADPEFHASVHSPSNFPTKEFAPRALRHRDLISPENVGGTRLSYPRLSVSADVLQVEPMLGLVPCFCRRYNDLSAETEWGWEGFPLTVSPQIAIN